VLVAAQTRGDAPFAWSLLTVVLIGLIGLGAAMLLPAGPIVAAQPKRELT